MASAEPIAFAFFKNLLWTLAEYVLSSAMARQYFRNLKETGSPQSVFSLVCLSVRCTFTVFAFVSSGLSSWEKTARIPGVLRISARVSFINVSCQFFDPASTDKRKENV